MRMPTIKIDRREYVLIPKSEYQKWQKQRKSTTASIGSQVARKLPIESYTDQRVAEFLLTNTTDTADYARACKLVRQMGLDPAKIDHDKPAGVK